MLQRIVLGSLLTLSILSYSHPSLACNDAACYGKQAVDQFNQLWGDEDEFVADWENEIKPMINQWMGVGVAAAGFGLVLRALVK